MARKQPDPINTDIAQVTGSAIPPSKGKKGETTAEPVRRAETPVVTDPFQQFVATSVRYPFIQTDIALPQTIERAEELYGLEIFEQMMSEPVLAGAFNYMKIRILSNGLTLLPSKPKPSKRTSASDRALYDKSIEIKNYCNYVLKAVERQDRRKLYDINWNFLDGIKLGHKLAEVTKLVFETGPYAGKLGLQSIRPKPRENYTLVVDTMQTIRGIVAKIPGGSIALREGIVFDLAYLANAISPDKLMIYTIDDRDGDPRGRSWFRWIYGAYLSKKTKKPQVLNAIYQIAGQRVSIEMGEDQRDIEFYDPRTGQLNPLIDRITDEANNWIQNGSGTFVHPNGSKLQLHSPTGDLQVFETAFDRDDREMITGLLGSPRALKEAEHGSKADTGDSVDVADEFIEHGRTRLCAIWEQLLYGLVRDSYGQDVANEFTPRVTMVRNTAPDFADDSIGVAALLKADPNMPVSRREYLYTERLGCPPLEDQELEELEASLEEGNAVVSEDSDEVTDDDTGGEPQGADDVEDNPNPPVAKPTRKPTRAKKR